MVATVAASIEGVVKSKPMAYLMHESIALIVRGRRPAVHAGPQIHHTIVGTAGIGTGEGGPTQQPVLKLREENVEGGLIAPPMGGLDVDRTVLSNGRTASVGNVLAVVGSRRIGVLILDDFNVETKVGVSVDVGILERRLLSIDHCLGDALVQDVKVSLDGNGSGLEHAAAVVGLHVLVLADEVVGCLALRFGRIRRLATSPSSLKVGPGRPRARRILGTVTVTVASALQTTDAMPVIMVMIMVVMAMVVMVMSMRNDTGRRRGKENCGSLNELHGGEL